MCVDTSVLLDVLKDEHPESQEKLYNAISERHTLLVPTVVVAELVPQFSGNMALLDSFLSDHQLRVEPLDQDSSVCAASRWVEYLKRKTKVKCPHCHQSLEIKEHFLSDFYIGGFALKKCAYLLTRDRGIYRKYFKDLILV
jgi:predicted nucleic acid-binding protein